ncbi:hypothetical protein MARA_01750 (plasmid) [Mycolicibacterium arabiense]|uniref:Uncharacterized protein n=1 Tax=Mycolicibacterium arabiense TaxID=1286181 RepID=A0A7I7RSG5_9MYCO|nr:hypothetical protein [Mycolicibacterium arabiense]MCV7376934.1 hypothetical protein [Mycolicibacterium arabiense]BBY46745.1 hypothetical protein MARA_01750 [Mycolicibacterium arabiense]
MNQPLQSPSGGIVVVTTERGLPTAIKLDRHQLKTAPAHLAREILALCQLSAKRAQVTRRRELTARGFGSTALAPLKLTTEAELAVAEAEVFGGTEFEPHPSAGTR